jgi:hypothetical protein
MVFNPGKIAGIRRHHDHARPFRRHRDQHIVHDQAPVTDSHSASAQACQNSPGLAKASVIRRDNAVRLLKRFQETRQRLFLSTCWAAREKFERNYRADENQRTPESCFEIPPVEPGS